MRRNLLLSLVLALALPTGVPRSAQAFDWLGRIEIDADGLKSEDPELRLKAVRDLQRYAIEWTQEHLLGALQDEDVLVRSAAGRVLAKHGVQAAVPIIIKWLAESHVQSKQVAADILGELGAAEAVSALVRSLGDPEPTVRVRAVKALGKIGGSTVIVPLVTRLEDDKADVRKAAVLELRELGDARAVIPLVGLFDDASLEVRVAAVQSVGSLKDPAAVPALLRELGDRPEAVKIAAVTSLGNLGAKRALPELVVALERGTTAYRAKVAYSLAQIAALHPKEAESARALVKLVGLLSSSTMRNAAREALFAAGVAAVPTLIDSLDDKIPGDPGSVVEILLSLGDKRATPSLIAELDRGRIAQRSVLQALQNIGDPRALMPVLALLEDKDPKVRRRAMETLGSMLGTQGEAADIIADRLADKDLEIRRLAARYLGEMRSRAAVPALKRLALEAKEPSLQATALSSLGQIGDDSAAAVALQILEVGSGANSQMLRPVAADALAELASPKARAPLLKLVKQSTLSWRALAIEALGATLRGKSDAAASRVLLAIARGPDTHQALAAIEALSAMKSPETAETFAKLARSGEPERRHAAVVALGAIGHKAGAPQLRDALRDGGDVLGAAAAWSLAEIGDTKAVPLLLQACRRSGVATAVNASAALALLASESHVDEIAKLLYHQSALVRVNAVMALARLGATKHSNRLQAMLESDSSITLKTAILRGLSMLGTGHKALESVAKSEGPQALREAAKALQARAFAPAARDNWSIFRVVDPQADDKAVAQEARFFLGSDGLATVAHSDRRGRIIYQNFPGGAYVQGALADLSRF